MSDIGKWEGNNGPADDPPETIGIHLIDLLVLVEKAIDDYGMYARIALYNAAGDEISEPYRLKRYARTEPLEFG